MPLRALLLTAQLLAPAGLPEPGPLVAHALGAGGTEAHLAAAADVVRLAGASRDPRLVGRVLLGLDRGLRGRTDLALPSALAEALDAVPESDHAHPVNQVRRLRIQLRTRAPRARAVARGFLRNEDPRLRGLRIEVVGVLGELAEPDSLEALIVLARDSADAEVRRAALLALQHYAEPGVAGRVLSFLPESAEPEVGAELLSRRAPWARDLVRMVAEGRVPFDAVLPEHVARMRRFADPELDLALAGLWGAARGADDRARELERLLAAWRDVDAPAGDAPRPNLERGRVVFRDACARCHDRGVGPPTRALPRGDSLLVGIAEPAAYESGRDWQEWELVAAGGLRVTGLLVEDRGGVVTLEDTLGFRTTLRRAPDVRLEPIRATLMPVGLTAPMSDADLRALLAWLVSRPE